jgi:hypothetical protein
MTPQPMNEAMIAAVSEATTTAGNAMREKWQRDHPGIGALDLDPMDWAATALEAAVPIIRVAGRGEVIGIVRRVHRESTLEGSHCVNCRFAWPCPTEQAIIDLEAMTSGWRTSAECK